VLEPKGEGMRQNDATAPGSDSRVELGGASIEWEARAQVRGGNDRELFKR
jgi:hypothetical protein